MQKTGPQIIDTMVGKFQGIVDGLDKGVALCEDKKGKNEKVIDSLTAENNFLNTKTQEAKIFRDNLKVMLTKKPEKTQKENKKDNE